MKKKILIVDDDKEFSALLKEVLDDRYFIKLSSNGLDALEILKTWEPDLILLDQDMPEMDGTTTCKQIRENGSTNHIPIIMLTGMDSQTDRKRAYLLGVDDFISKPFETDELVIRINSKIKRITSPIATNHIDHLKPLSKPSDFNLLIAETNSKNRNLIKTALAGMGVAVQTCKSSDEITEILNNITPDILFISSDLIDVLDKTNHLEIKTVLLTNSASRNLIEPIKKYPKISNIIEIKDDDRSFNIKSILVTTSKILSGDIFGISKYLNWGVEIFEFKITGSKQRHEILYKIEKKIEELGIRSAIRSQCITVAEELLMNAIYDAPRDVDGTPLHNHKPRTEEIILEPNHQATLKIASDGLFLGISIEDPFGAFKKETIIKYLDINHQEESSITLHSNEIKGGAGKGLFMITENSDLVIYNIHKNKKTEVIAIFDLDPAREKKNTSIHYFSIS